MRVSTIKFMKFVLSAVYFKNFDPYKQFEEKLQAVQLFQVVMFFKRCVAIKIAVFQYPNEAFTSFVLLWISWGVRQR